MITSPISGATVTALEAAGLPVDAIVKFIQTAFDEDLGPGIDITSAATISAASTSSAEFVARMPGVAAGIPVVCAILEMAIPESTGRHIEGNVADGATFARGDSLISVTGPTLPILTAERTALNVLSRLCGVATHTRAWFDALEGTTTKVRDTRKTTPGMRLLEKYAVRCGGGVNHRIGLWDAVLIKDNHVAAAGGVGAALDRVCAHLGVDSDVMVQVEVDTLAQLSEALDHGATQVLLDNMSPVLMTQAVALTRARNLRVLLEASGGITLANAAAVAATGVDFIAVGALTHSSPLIDIGLDFHTAT